MPSRQNSLSVFFCCFLGMVSLLAMPAAAHARAQQPSAEYAAKKQQADQLYTAGKLTDAEKAYEELASSPDGDADKSVQSRLGFLLYGTIYSIQDDQQRTALAERVRAILLKARELGDNTPLTNTMIDALAHGTPAYFRYSTVNEADAAMRQGEQLYMAGNYEPAIEFYKKALDADPKLYSAALYIGDCLFKTPGKQDEAQVWFARSISINPFSETAYRYWADDLVKLGNVQEARDKYIEAYITEPSNRLPVAALQNFATTQHITIGHPAVKIPLKINVTSTGYTVTFDPGLMGNTEPVAVPFKAGTSSDGFGAMLDPNLPAKYPTLKSWMAYASALILWQSGYLAAHPNEHSVRDYLIEEALAFRAAISGIDPKATDLDPALAMLLKLDQDGVLEAYILLARSNAGVSQDYHQYLTDHRDLLRKYVVDWVMTNGGTQK
jgi:tetratricopeptide (TPR) repeat protein